MNDHDRFTKLAKESLAVLRRIADGLQSDGVAGQARADAIRTHARRLYEFAYQAGVAEARLQEVRR